MSNSYYIDLTGVENRTELHDRIEQGLPVPEWYGRNLDALKDCLEEVDEETDVVLDRECITIMCENPYAYKVLLVLGRAAENNPNLNILFR
jgi:RNAse (barnase) inhibitor barstar